MRKLFKKIKNYFIKIKNDPDKMKRVKRGAVILLVFTIVGAISGYLYYYFIGCLDGSCSIASSPVNMTIFGTLIGFLLGLIFT